MMGSLIDELQRREAAAREEAEELRERIAQLTERLAGVEERLSRLVIARETVDEVLGGASPEASPTVTPEETAGSRFGHLSPVGVLTVPPWRPGLEASVLPEGYRTCWRWRRMPGARCGRRRSPRRPGSARTRRRWKAFGRS